MTITTYPMPDPTLHGNVRVRTTTPEIWQVEFRRIDALPGQARDQEEEERDNVNLELGIQRGSRDTIGVQLNFKIEEEGVFSGKVDCRLILNIVPVNEGEKIDFESALKHAAARVAPVVMYPYIREAITGLSLKAGLEPIVLPVINVANLFDIEAVNVPPFSEGNRDDSEAELMEGNDQ